MKKAINNPALFPEFNLQYFTNLAVGWVQQYPITSSIFIYKVIDSTWGAGKYALIIRTKIPSSDFDKTSDERSAEFTSFNDKWGKTTADNWDETSKELEYIYNNKTDFNRKDWCIAFVGTEQKNQIYGVTFRESCFWSFYADENEIQHPASNPNPPFEFPEFILSRLHAAARIWAREYPNFISRIILYLHHEISELRHGEIKGSEFKYNLFIETEDPEIEDILLAPVRESERRSSEESKKRGKKVTVQCSCGPVDWNLYSPEAKAFVEKWDGVLALESEWFNSQIKQCYLDENKFSTYDWYVGLMGKNWELSEDVAPEKSVILFERKAFTPAATAPKATQQQKQTGRNVIPKKKKAQKQGKEVPPEIKAEIAIVWKAIQSLIQQNKSKEKIIAAAKKAYDTNKDSLKKIKDFEIFSGCLTKPIKYSGPNGIRNFRTAVNNVYESYMSMIV